VSINRIFSYKKLQNDYIFCVLSDKNVLLESISDIRIFGITFMTLGIVGLIAIFLFLCSDYSNIFKFSFVKSKFKKETIEIPIPQENRTKVFNDSLSRLIEVTDKIAESKLDKYDNIQISSKLLDYTKESVDTVASFVDQLIENTDKIIQITNMTEFANKELTKPEYEFEKKLKKIVIKLKKIESLMLPGEIKETIGIVKKAIDEILLSIKRLKDISFTQMEAAKKLQTASARLAKMCEEITKKNLL
jgi:methyl-accepting chemotaxis protein